MTGLNVAKALAKMKDIQINSRELIDEWVLITYDIPVTEDGNKARSNFLKLAPKIGAIMHSRSVYLMPNTKQAQAAAVELSATIGGDVYIWTSKVDEQQAKQITSLYDKKISEKVEHLYDRIKKENELILNEKFGMADRMHRKSVNLFHQLLFSAIQRGINANTHKKLVDLESKLYKDI